MNELQMNVVMVCSGQANADMVGFNNASAFLQN